MSVFLNVSNHPSASWNEQQIKAAEAYGNIIDIQFPEIDPESPTEEICRQAEEYLKKVTAYDNPIVMVQGEFTFSYSLIQRLRKNNVVVVAACSRRKTDEKVLGDGSTQKVSIFEFCGFREYE